MRHRLSAPPTTAASQTPAAIMRAALPKAFAVEEIGPHANIVQHRHRPHVGIDAGRLEITRLESGALVAQGAAHRLHSRAEAVHDGNLADEERLHSSPAGFYSPGSLAQAETRETALRPRSDNCSSSAGNTASTTAALSCMSSTSPAASPLVRRLRMRCGSVLTASKPRRVQDT